MTEPLLHPSMTTPGELTFEDAGTYAMYRALLQVIIQHTGCSQLAAYRALDPCIRGIWYRATAPEPRKTKR